MAQNVKFFFTSDLNKYLNLATKDSMALYFVEDAVTGFTGLYKGENLIAVGSDATSMSSGLMSAADKKSLDELIAVGASTLQPVDGSIVITNDGNDKKIGVAISGNVGNTLTLVEGGLFVPAPEKVSVPEYSIEKQETASDGFTSTYKLKKTVNGEVTYVGDEINIAKDLVLKSATMQTVTEKNVPYDGALVGDPYIDMEFNDEAETHLYIPMSGLVDQFVAGNGIKIENNIVSINLGANTNGLYFVDGTLNLALATKDSAGALSPVDKAFIDSIPNVYATKELVKKTAEQVKYEITNKPYGTLVNYSENEIRVMCPADTKWTKQSVGGTGNANMYYMGFKAYAPEGAVSFKEGDRGVIVDEMFTFDSDFAGTDEFGRNYSICWLALASYDSASDTWTYFGKNSSVERYIGWDYVVEWYDANGKVIATDSIRINLSNEDCHMNTKPYYMTNYATVEHVDSLKEEVNNSMSWGEL